ncbi:1-deoxy-D-xylulose 5-phosphate reductoisomerase [Amylibacter marinus]|uniref:1-deoxy-D-xylulose 5-phosphate reductoisomerase n=1 Tax=Amylibacter marinus TaxID=1475483 RepID=A0ABQ5VS19_9RHOB|nr:1-deoxy-D-xylulose-5-phosphate reductoisomerase [Amylibacter marinus]GLQ34220.1 1-deoxy-D-xylulose 5-phosphate reductoisomerase [Amylibacter marinus]
MKRLAVFGATGSIGGTCAQVLARDPAKFDVVVLTGGRNLARLAELARALSPRAVVIQDESDLAAMRALLSGMDIEVSAGRAALLDAARRPVDISLQAIVGFAGVETSLIAAAHADVVALANKETMVCAGPMMRRACAQHATTLLPVDSEHSALFQCLLGEKMPEVERMILTASGGPFLNTPLAELHSVTPAQAASHPRWEMGMRISIDSASLFNKAMEMIEARELFDIAPEKIEVVVHPQSIIHSMIGFVDGAIMAHMGPPDMAGAIGYALYYPDRCDAGLARLDFSALSRLDFQPPDAQKFPALGLATKAMTLSGFAGTVFNAAKEQALDLFLENRISFVDMSGLVEAALDDYTRQKWGDAWSVEKLNSIDAQTRVFVTETASKAF